MTNAIDVKTREENSPSELALVSGLTHRPHQLSGYLYFLLKKIGKAKKYGRCKNSVQRKPKLYISWQFLRITVL